MQYGPLPILSVSWPVGFVSLPFGLVNCLLLCFFGDSIEAYGSMRAFTDFSRWGGIETLFSLNSAVLGWLGVVVAANRTGVAGFALLLLVLPWCFASIGGGFVFEWFRAGSFSDAVWSMLAYSLVSVVGASVFRSYWGNIH